MNTCKICGNTENNEYFVVKEMMFGTRDKFTYMKCADCGCLQLINIPNDMSKYYPSENYYSYHSKAKEVGKLKKTLRKIFIFCYNHNLVPLCGQNYNFETLKSLKIKFSSSILDIGCGNGKLIKILSRYGYEKATGIDPFIENDTDDGIVKIFKTDVCNFSTKCSESKKTFDLIMLHHSFEHIENQHETMEAIHKLLSPDGFLLVRIPVCDCLAFRKYKENWFQIDAPRHFFLHSLKSMSFLAKTHNFSLKKIFYDSDLNQIIMSEKYCQDITLRENYEISAKRIKNLNKFVEFLNDIGDGDQACFILKKK